MGKKAVHDKSVEYEVGARKEREKLTFHKLLTLTQVIYPECGW